MRYSCWMLWQWEEEDVADEEDDAEQDEQAPGGPGPLMPI